MHFLSLKRKIVALPTPHFCAAHMTTIMKITTLIRLTIVHTFTANFSSASYNASSSFSSYQFDFSCPSASCHHFYHNSYFPNFSSFIREGNLITRGYLCLSLSLFPSIFEISISSHSISLTKTQRWNRGCHMRRALKSLDVINKYPLSPKSLDLCLSIFMNKEI